VGGDQLALPFDLRARYTRAAFIEAPSNAEARAWLALPAWPEGRLWVWGVEGVGKSHLISVWAAEHGGHLLYGPDLSEAMVERVLSAGLKGPVVLDEADRVTDGRALLHLVNGVRERSERLLMAGRLPPARIEMALPDLASRLRGSASVVVGSGEERLLSSLLLALLAERQIVVPQPVTEWLRRHLPRSQTAYVRAVALLDRAGLAAGRPVSRAMAQEVLSGLVMAEGAPHVSDEKLS